MPQKYTLKHSTPATYYHIFSSAATSRLFLDAEDYKTMLELLGRYLAPRPQRSRSGTAYPHYSDQIELVSFSLISDRLHLVVYQRQAGALEPFMRSLMTSYARYYNRRHNHTGPVFAGRYKARPVEPADLPLLSRFVHRSPRNWPTYRYSSLAYYIDKDVPNWLSISHIAGLFDGPWAYAEYLEDEAGVKNTRHTTRQILAGK